MASENYEQKDDSALLSEYVAGNCADAFAALVRRHTPLVYSVCLRVLGDKEAAQDALQATFLVLVRRAPGLSRDTLVPAWLYTLALRIARNAARSRARRAAYEKNAAMRHETSRDPLRDASMSELKHQVDGALASLRHEQRDAIVLRYLCGHSEAEAAEILKCPLNTLHTRVTTGLSRLRQRLARHDLNVTPAVLTVFLTENLIEQTPSGLSVSVASTCLGQAKASEASAMLADSIESTAGGLCAKLIAAVLISSFAVAGAYVLQRQPAPESNTSSSLALAPDAQAAAGRDFYAAADAAEGTGSLASPWALNTALASKMIQPGDTLWLRAGTYTGAFKCTLQGSLQRPISIRAHNNERVLISGTGIQAALTIAGAHIQIYDLEVQNPIPRRVEQPAQNDAAIGVTLIGKGLKLLNLVVHDCSTGIAAWREAVDTEIRGCIVYNNGYELANSRHGSGIVLQNLDGTKRVSDCIVFNNFTYGLSAYGTARSSVRKLWLEQNVVFGSGSPAAEPSADLHLGGDRPLQEIFLSRNYTWQSSLTNKSLRLSSIWANVNEQMQLNENYIVGGVSCERDFQRFVFVNNTVIADRPMTLHAENLAQFSNYKLQDNRYLIPRVGLAFSTVLAGKSSVDSFEGWQQTTSLDKTSTLSVGRPAQAEVFVVPTQHDPSRAHVIVYNWSRSAEVLIPLSSLTALKAGEHCEVRRAQDYYGEPVLEATYRGEPLRVSLHSAQVPMPIGGSTRTPAATAPDFDVFVVIRK